MAMSSTIGLSTNFVLNALQRRVAADAIKDQWYNSSIVSVAAMRLALQTERAMVLAVECASSSNAAPQAVNEVCTGVQHLGSAVQKSQS